MTFDPDLFMSKTIDQPLSTKMSIPPEGEYRAMIGDFDRSAFEEITTKKGEVRHIFRCPVVLQNDERLAKIGRDSFTARKDFFLDLAPDGTLDLEEGKNVNLGQLLAAVGQNQSGVSLSKLRNSGPVMAQIKHRPNPNDPENPFIDVGRITALK